MTPHTHPIRVYYEDTDAGGMVYHAAYLGFAERARTEALRAAGLPHAELIQKHGVMFVVRRVNIEYLRRARLDDLLAVRTESVADTAVTVTLRQSVLHGEAVVAVLEVQLVCIRTDTHQPVRIPARWRDALAA